MNEPIPHMTERAFPVPFLAAQTAQPAACIPDRMIVTASITTANITIPMPHTLIRVPARPRIKWKRYAGI